MPAPPCNWMFFGVLVNIALKSVGFPYSEQVLSDYLDYIESCYLGGGWYLDGQNGEKTIIFPLPSIITV